MITKGKKILKIKVHKLWDYCVLVMMCFIYDEIFSLILISIVFNCVIQTDIVSYVEFVIVSVFLELSL